MPETPHAEAGGQRMLSFDDLADEVRAERDEAARRGRARKTADGKALTVDDFGDVTIDDLRRAGLI